MILLAAVLAAAQVSMRADRTSVPLGDRLAIELAAAAGAGERMRFAAPPRLDPRLALVALREESAAEGRGAGLEIEVLACGPGSAEIGPFELVLELPGKGEVAVRTETLRVEIEAPWGEGPTPPYPDWWRPAPPDGAHRWWLAAAVALVAGAVAAAWVRARRRPRSRGPDSEQAPRRAAAIDRSILEVPIPEDVGARREWCERAMKLLRDELSARGTRDRRACSGEDLVAGDALAGFDAGDRGRLAELIGRFELGMFARHGCPALGDHDRERLRDLLARDAP